MRDITFQACLFLIINDLDKMFHFHSDWPHWHQPHQDSISGQMTHRNMLRLIWIWCKCVSAYEVYLQKHTTVRYEMIHGFYGGRGSENRSMVTSPENVSFEGWGQICVFVWCVCRCVDVSVLMDACFCLFVSTYTYLYSCVGGIHFHCEHWFSSEQHTSIGFLP